MEVEPQPAFQPLQPKVIQWTPSKDTIAQFERTASPMNSRLEQERRNESQGLHGGLHRQHSFTPLKRQKPEDASEARTATPARAPEPKEKERDSLKRKEPPVGWQPKQRKPLYYLPIVCLLHSF
jgi:hypothetical protein